MKTEIINNLIDALKFYKRYYAELLYWAAQCNFPTDEKMREHASSPRNFLYDEAMKELHRVRESFYYMYEDTEDEEEAYAVDFDRVVRQIQAEAGEIAEKMRRVNGIFIK